MLRERLSFIGICPALKPSNNLISSEREAHTHRAWGPRLQCSQFNSTCILSSCYVPGLAQILGEWKETNLIANPLPGSRTSLVPGVPRRKALQPDKAGWPHSMPTWALLPSPGSAVHPLPHGEKLPSALLASFHFCLQKLWSHQPCAGGWGGGHSFTVTRPPASPLPPAPRSTATPFL